MTSERPDDRTATGQHTTETSAEVTLDGHRAGATVVVTAAVAPPSAVRAATARAWLVSAEESAGDGRFADSADAARRGLDELGDAYVDRDRLVVDDTELHLVLADDTDDEDRAAALLRDALGARLSAYQWRHDDLGLRFDPPIEEDR